MIERRQIERMLERLQVVEAALTDPAVLGNPRLLPDIFEGLNAQKSRIRYGCAKALRLISEQRPGVLYPHFDLFVHLLDHENQIFQWDAAFALAVYDIKINAVESKSVSRRPSPIYILEIGRFCFVVQRHISVLDQPVVKMYFIFESSEPVVGKHKETHLLEAQFIDMRLNFADKLVELHIPLLHKFRVAFQKHVLDAVQAVEDPRQHAFFKFIQLVEEYFFA